jgi:hypothetical protein
MFSGGLGNDGGIGGNPCPVGGENCFCICSNHCWKGFGPEGQLKMFTA